MPRYSGQKLQHSVAIIAGLLLVLLLWAALTPAPEQEATVPQTPPASAVAIASRTPARATSTPAGTPTPFPTAERMIALFDRRAIARDQREGLLVELELADTRVLAGSVISARVRLQNTGPETIGNIWPRLIIKNQNGWFFDDAWYGSLTTTGDDQVMVSPQPYTINTLKPGKAITITLFGYVPRDSVTEGARPGLWGSMHFISPLNVGSPTRLEIGPIPLESLPPAPEQQLTARFRIDRYSKKFWCLRATAGPPNGPFWASLEVRSSDGHRIQVSDFESTRQGIWCRDQQFYYLDRNPAQLWMRVAAPGFAAAVITQSLPLSMTKEELPFSQEHTEYVTSEVFSSIEEAEAYLSAISQVAKRQATGGQPVIKHIPLNHSFDDVTIRIFKHRSEDIQIFQSYWLPSGDIVYLQQTLFDTRLPGYLRHNPAVHQVAIGQYGGYLTQSRYQYELELYWVADDRVMVLRAPKALFTFDEIVHLAQQIR